MADQRDDEDLLRETLRDRARRAMDEARETVRTSEILGSTLEAVRAAFSARCAWCGRYRVGGKWLELDDLPRIAAGLERAEVSHGICPSCIEKLRAAGKSV